MGYERYPRNTNPQGDYYGRRDPQDYGRDYGSGRDYSYSSARDYRAAGQYDDDRGGRGNRDDRYGDGARGDSDRGYGSQRPGGRDYGNQGYGSQGYGNQGDRRPGCYQRDEYRGSYAHDGHRWQESGRDRDDDRGRYGRPSQQDQDDRGFLARAGDEVRSWFGDEDAERRRERDARYDEQYASRHDDDYHGWRSGQIASLDRDYDEYRRENRTKFENEFSAWRTTRQGQRDSLKSVREHMEVLGSDGEHVGTVDKVRGDRILLTKNDADAGGRHHSIPSRWIDKVADQVTLSKTATEAKQAWQDEENNQAMFGDDTGGDARSQRQDGDRRDYRSPTGDAGYRATGSTASSASSTGDGTDAGAQKLNKSFSGTY